MSGGSVSAGGAAGTGAGAGAGVETGAAGVVDWASTVRVFVVGAEVAGRAAVGGVEGWRGGLSHHPTRMITPKIKPKVHMAPFPEVSSDFEMEVSSGKGVIWNGEDGS